MRPQPATNFDRLGVFPVPRPQEINKATLTTMSRTDDRLKQLQWGAKQRNCATGLETTAWLATRQILPQAKIWRSQILARIPRIPWILELDSARILTWMPPKLDYNPGIRGCFQPCCATVLDNAGFNRKDYKSVSAFVFMAFAPQQNRQKERLAGRRRLRPARRIIWCGKCRVVKVQWTPN